MAEWMNIFKHRKDIKIYEEDKELRPCPFCGGAAYFDVNHYIENNYVAIRFSIRCRECNTTNPNTYGTILIRLDTRGEFYIFHDDREKAIDEWNRRSETK